MKKAVLAMATLLLILGLVAEVTAYQDTTQYQLVIDRSTRSKPLNDYVLLTRDSIQRAWKTPMHLASQGSVKGRIRVNYTLKRSGALAELKLIRGSGNTDMDRSLLSAIRQAQPFPPFPEGVNAQQVMIRANFIVADLPTAQITQVSQPVPRDVSQALRATQVDRPKLLWGKPAGSSHPPAMDKVPVAPQVSDDVPSPPARSKKLHWGAK